MFRGQRWLSGQAQCQHAPAPCMVLALCRFLSASLFYPLYYDVLVRQSLCVAFIHQRDKFKNKVTGCPLN